MTKFEMFDIFEEAFDTVMDEFGLTFWWELFDAEEFSEVEWRIAQMFNVEDANEVEYFSEWVNEMADEL